MFKLNKGIILEDCLISFMLISTYLLLMSAYLGQVYQLQSQIKTGFDVVNEMKVCILGGCEPSQAKTVRTVCDSYLIKQSTKEICVEI